MYMSVCVYTSSVYIVYTHKCTYLEAGLPPLYCIHAQMHVCAQSVLVFALTDERNLQIEHGGIHAQGCGWQSDNSHTWWVSSRCFTIAQVATTHTYDGGNISARVEMRAPTPPPFPASGFCMLHACLIRVDRGFYLLLITERVMEPRPRPATGIGRGRIFPVHGIYGSVDINQSRMALQTHSYIS